MNKIYKTVWNEASQAGWRFELDTAHGKRNVRSSTGAAGKAGFAFNLAGIAAACMMALGAFVSTPASASVFSAPLLMALAILMIPAAT